MASETDLPPMTPGPGGIGKPPRPLGPIGKYEVLNEIASGGMGTVYRARHVELRREVALKMIKAGMDSRAIVSRFAEERHVLARLNHPNVASIQDSGTTETDRPYFVMEYVPGAPITKYCDTNGLSVEERLELFIQVCQGIEHAHRRNILHRDIKPSNVLVFEREDQRVIKVIDFGIARALDREQRDETWATQEGMPVGTPAYMSPEQVEGRTDLDGRTDVYSLGVLLYELLVGQLPFEIDSINRGFDELRRVIREVVPKTPSTRAKHARQTPRGEGPDSHEDLAATRISKDLDAITMRALEKERDRRYPSAFELAADVARHLRGEPVWARLPTFTYRATKFLMRNRLALGWTALALLAALATAVGTWILVQRSQFNARLSQSQTRLEEGRHLVQRYGDLSRIIGLLEEKRRGAAGSSETAWKPVWYRMEEAGAVDQLREALEDASSTYTKALFAFHGSAQLAPEDSEVKDKALSSLRDVQALTEQREAQIYLGRRESLGARFSGGSETGIVSLESNPPKSEVYCFRYERYEMRLLPLAFRPSVGVSSNQQRLGKPFLVIDEVLDENQCPFEELDRFDSVNGRTISSHTDLARVLSSVDAEESVTVVLVRSDDKVDVEWVPFPGAIYDQPNKLPRGHRLEPGLLVDPRSQFGFSFAGYPLEFSAHSLLGVCPLQIELPVGSYLFVFRQEGFEDVRMPLLITSASAQKKAIRLLRASEIPPGFVYVPDGTVSTGGDLKAFQPIEDDEHQVAQFFIQKLEVTIGEWFRFVNDPDVVRRTKASGETLPVTEGGKDLLGKLGLERFQLLPTEKGTLYDVERNADGTWNHRFPEDRPMFQVCHIAAVEYAAWLTQENKKTGAKQRWLFRLPTDLEWERASRGVDRRHFTWGNYMVWSRCLSFPGRYGDYNLTRVGVHPFDESVFGVRDMCGSVTEHTSGSPVGGLYRSYRGGAYDVYDEYFFRLATRNSIYPDQRYMHFGVRLVAVPSN